MTFFVSPKSYSVLLKHKALSHKPAFEEIAQKALDQSRAFASYTQALVPEVPAVHYGKLVHPHLQHSAAVEVLIKKTLLQQRRVLSTFPTQRMSLLSFVQQCIFESGTRVLFGDTVVDHNPTLRQAFQTFDTSFPLFVAGVPSLLLPSASKARRSLVHALDSNPGADAATIIQKRTEAVKTTFPTNVVAPLDAAKESLALLWAANANSIPTAFWSLFYLLDNPVAWSTVRDEVREHLGKSIDWTGDQLGKCVFLASAVDEALRLSASSLMMRVATEDVNLNVEGSHVHLAKGSKVMIFPSLGHFDDAIFPQPRTFQFDRFVQATSAQLEAFNPFGMGVTMCPGRNFAKNQVKRHRLGHSNLIDRFDRSRCSWRS
ncbi:hypothetical protein H310_01412 [Aphanomyces invadans]|uniref:Cytochrome P450 n=1 Tax=Aphanomyces invadans TaxID=157072 RepID=A0A024URN0_9STRA|nr:hypothetical protein H310_01412 [Aphanomyces invadans]ETW08929.1 hypothetical protein H310_01412 [Aphanomyces invadans]|eukprot:XP_008862734.1 hypothetical protein H310_01412 [Aphanomyces invadans]